MGQTGTDSFGDENQQLETFSLWVHLVINAYIN